MVSWAEATTGLSVAATMASSDETITVSLDEAASGFRECDCTAPTHPDRS